MMLHATEILSEFAAGLEYSDLPKEAVDATKLYICDYYAACFAGYAVNDGFGKAVRDIIEAMGGAPEAKPLFSDIKMPAENAAFLNAIYAHGADMDDGNRKAMGHVGAHVISAVFALAETLDVSWQEVFTAINVGYEVYDRVAAAVQPGLVHRGFHSTGTAGAVACAAACAKLLGLDKDGIYNAMSLGAIQASGLIIIAESGQACKPLNPANAAKTGIFSAKLAKAGIESSHYPLESKKGWFHAMSDEVDEKMITDGLGTDFTICECYIKPYPSCRHTHCGIEAALKLREMVDGLCAERVKAVRVYIYENAIKIAGQIKHPATQDESKFSVHYALAAALAKGHFDLSDLDIDACGDEVDAIIDKIELIKDESMEDRDKGIRGARVELELTDGEVLSHTVIIPKGDAANPFTWQDMSEKLAGCMECAKVPSAFADRIAERIRTLNCAEKFSDIYSLINEVQK